MQRYTSSEQNRRRRRKYIARVLREMDSDEVQQMQREASALYPEAYRLMLATQLIKKWEAGHLKKEVMRELDSMTFSDALLPSLHLLERWIERRIGKKEEITDQPEHGRNTIG